MKKRFMSGLLVALTFALVGCSGSNAEWKPSPNDPVYDRLEFAAVWTYDRDETFEDDQIVAITLNVGGVDELGGVPKLRWIDNRGTPHQFPFEGHDVTQWRLAIEWVSGWKVNAVLKAEFEGTLGQGVRCGWQDASNNDVLGGVTRYVTIEDIEQSYVDGKPKLNAKQQPVGKVACQATRTMI